MTYNYSSHETDYYKAYCDFYGYPEVDPEDPFIYELAEEFDLVANKGKYHMTYQDMVYYLDKSLSYVYKMIPQYVQSGELLQYGTRKAEFVLPSYNDEYLAHKDRLNINKLKTVLLNPLFNDEWNTYIEQNWVITDLRVYMQSLQLRTLSSIPPDSIKFNESKPLIVRRKLPCTIPPHHYYCKFLYYKSGKVVIHVDFSELPMYANLQTFKILFRNIRRILRFDFNTTLPPSFIISQFNGYRKPFKERPKQPIYIKQAYNLLDLLDYINNH